MKRCIAVLITGGLLATVVFWGRDRREPEISDGSLRTPEQCILRMFEAAERGDVMTYLDCFTGPEQQRLRRELADQLRDDFASELMKTVATLKGRAVYEATEGVNSGDQSFWVVERVYAQRMEKQHYQLLHESGAWRIHSVQNPEAYQAEKKYGTPVVEPPSAEH